MSVVVIGAGGQLGSDLVRVMGARDLVALTHDDIEICDFDSVCCMLKESMPDVVINTAAFHRVDDCETEQDKAFQVNAMGARNLAVVCQQIGSKLVHIGTDYIFGGEAEPHLKPYTEFDVPVPPNVYGKSKLTGEEFIRHLCNKHFIVRASGLFGIAGASGKGGNFIETMLRLASERDKLKVVSDQIFSPTYTKDLAKKILELMDTDLYGIYHVTNVGSCSWYEFAKEILRLAGSQTPIEPITSAQYPQKAKRPNYSVLDHYHLRLLGTDDVRTWQEALSDYIREREQVR